MTNKFFSDDSPCMSGSADELCECLPKDYVIKEEEEALAVLRGLKKQVHAAKAKRSEITQALEADSGNAKLKNELDACEAKLKELREQWDEWDRKRQSATREKLIRLGHISPDDPYWKVT
jgi:hypothetical protein